MLNWLLLMASPIQSRLMFKSKIHRATVTQAELDYEGSITIDPILLKEADILPHERVEVYNIDNGARFATYAIEGNSGSGVICVNGAAAHLVRPGHKVIICTYAEILEAEARVYKPKVVLVDERNRVSLKKAAPQSLSEAPSPRNEISN